MQVKKFEAPTIQEALDTIKRELGPEAIILQTKKNKSGFGLMSRASVEVTAAVSDRSLQKKSYMEDRLPEEGRRMVEKLPAEKQAKLADKYESKYIARQSRTELPLPTPAPSRKMTAQKYVDIDRRPSENDEDDMDSTSVAPVIAQAAQTTASGRPPMRARPLTPPASQASGAMAGKLGPEDISIEDEVKYLKRMLQEMKAVQETQTPQPGSGAQAMVHQTVLNSPALQDAFEQLVINGMDKRYAFPLMKRVAFELGDQRSKNPDSVMDQLATEIMQATDVKLPLSGIPAVKENPGPVILALVGPTGVGKTTTVAKMASEALLKRNLKVGLINVDSYKVAAFDQLGTYAKILNVPFRSTSSAEDLKMAIQDFQHLDLILIDTTGRSQRDPNSLREMEALLQSVPGIQTQLVLAVTTRDAELYDMAHRFSIFKPQGLIVSKLDEATLYGCIYNLGQRVKLPLLYFTTGQRVPEDIEEATPERVAALILDL